MLVASGDAPTCRILAAHAARRGWKVRTARDIAQAWNLLLEQPFDAVVLECRGPRFDGLKLTRILRGMSGPNQHTWIVGVTALHPRILGEADCLRAGMDRFLLKPVLREEFFQALPERSTV